MQPFLPIEALVLPLDRANVDTDAILPKQFMKSIERTGFGPFLFDEWRYLDRGELGQDCSKRPRNPDFPLNQPRYEDAQILLARENFGCGSSREHAPWALRDWGIRVLIAPSFAEIFNGNCFKNGLLPIRLDTVLVDALFAAVQATPGYRLKIDLEAQLITRTDGPPIAFEIDPFRKDCLLRGLDEVGLTLQDAAAIRAFEQARRDNEPWLFEQVA
jgi:3-isopropylmalate/(R)-2-methylmalate dehydratase small subunit